MSTDGDNELVVMSKRTITMFFGVRPWKRHGLVLLVAGLVYVATGLSYILAEATPSRQVALGVALAWAPIAFWGAVFMAAGLLSIISSRWPTFAETWGYMVLTGLSAGWSATYAAGVIFFDSPAANLSGAFLWGLLSFLWWAISGLLNPDAKAVTIPHGSS